MCSYRRELAHLISLVQQTLPQTPSCLVSSHSFNELSSFYKIESLAKRATQSSAPISNKSTASIQRPSPPPATKTQQKSISAPLLPQEIPPQEPEITPPSPLDRRYEKLLPVKKALPPTCPDKNKITEHTAVPSQTKTWSFLSYFCSQDSNELAAFMHNISEAISSKLSIQIKHFEKNEEHLSLRLRAIAPTCKALIICGEPHTQATIIGALKKLPSFEEQAHTMLYPLHPLGSLHDMLIYHLPLYVGIQQDIPMKKKLWASLQQLASL